MGLFLCGFSLILLQLVLSWHLGPVLHSSELPWLLLCCTALIGQGLGYGWTERGWSSIALALALSAPLLVTGVRGLHLGPPATLLVSALLATVTSFGLARLVSCYWQRRGGRALVEFYRVELAGALAGLLGAFLLGPLWATRLFPWAVLGAAWSLRSGRGRMLLGGLAAANSLGFTWACWQAARSAYPGDRLMALEISPYQYVEVVENRAGRFFFLNGLCHYGPAAYNQLNFFLAQLPAEHLSESARKQGCLVLGAGTFAAPALAASQGLATTVVELDPAVIRLGLEYFRSDRPAGDRFQVVNGDARHLLRQPLQFGLVVVNLPAPYSLNVASMFTQEFFEVLRQKVSADGVCTVFLGSPLDPAGADLTQGPILAAMLRAFPDVLAISSLNCQNTVVLGSSGSLGNVREWRVRLRSHGQNRFALYSRQQLAALTEGFSPSSLNDLRICAALNRTLWEGP